MGNLQKNVEFTKKFVMCTDKYFVVKQSLQIVQTWIWYDASKRQYLEWKHSSKKKFMLTVFWDVKGLTTIDFLGKGVTVNRASYCQFFWQNLTYVLNDPRV